MRPLRINRFMLGGGGKLSKISIPNFNTLLYPLSLSFLSFILSHPPVLFVVHVKVCTYVSIIPIGQTLNHPWTHDMKKGTAILDGSRRLWLPDFMTIGTWRRYRCHPYAQAAFTHQEIFLVFIGAGGWVDSRATVKNSSDTIRNESATFRLVAQCLSELRHRVPQPVSRYCLKYEVFLLLVCGEASLVGWYPTFRDGVVILLLRV